VYLQPDEPEAYPEAVKAIEEADFLVVGPGSLYTSVLPNLLVRSIREAILNASAVKVYVCNVATEPGETDGYSIADHVEALRRHLGGENPFHYVLANNRLGYAMPSSGRVQPVIPGEYMNGHTDPRIVLADVVDETNAVRHDPTKLAHTLMALHDKRVPESAKSLVAASVA
jgi:uncharacterized cofD-like protein